MKIIARTATYPVRAALKSCFHLRSRECEPSRGFTLIELLVVIAIIAILAAMLLPTLAKSKVQAQGIQCMNNTHELTYGWLMYADDSKGLVPDNTPFDPPGVWVLGWLELGQPNVPDNTNTVYLAKSLIAPDVGKSIPAWHCPADYSTAKEQQGVYPRARSVSMNGWLNCSAPFPNDHGVKMMYKLSDITIPSPANTFVLLDERMDSINDGFFAVDMLNTGASHIIWDWPASYHNGACGFSFADGHSEIHKWRDRRTTPPIGPQLSSTPSPNNQDLDWLQSHSTSLLLAHRTF